MLRFEPLEQAEPGSGGRGRRRNLSRHARWSGCAVAVVAFALLLTRAEVAVGEDAQLAAEQDEAARLYEASLDHWVERNVRVQYIAQRIALAGAGLCPDVLAPVLGVAVTDIEALPRELQPTARRRFGPKGRFVVTAAFEGMAGERAGLRVGDFLGKWGSVKVDSIATWKANRRIRGEASTIFVRRDREEVRIELEHERGCGFPASVSHHDEGNAYAHGSRISVTDALLRQVQSDDVLANWVGHEFAHNILKYQGRGKHRDFWRSRRHEREADYLGLYLSAMAGFEAVASTWSDRIGLTGVFAFERGYTHPALHERTVAIERTVAEIAGKRARGERLWPRIE